MSATSRPLRRVVPCIWGLAAVLLLAGCVSSGDVEEVRQEQEQAKAKMRTELEQERKLAATMEQESEAQKAAAAKLAKVLGETAEGKTSAPTASPPCQPRTIPGALAVQLVNDSGLHDSQVYGLLTGKSLGWPSGGPPPGLSYLDIAASPTGTQHAKPLTSMTPCGTITSAYTGKTRPIYQFGISAISSGRLMVSYGTPVAVTNGNFPTGTESFRWDKMEFGYPNSGADLTSMDFFGIPMQYDYLDSSGNILTTMSYYASTSTILSQLYGLSPQMKRAFQGVGSSSLGTWTPSQPLTRFARVMGPSLLASNSATGSPTPYPSFGAYLASLVGQSFTVSGAGNAGCPNQVGYTYKASLASDGHSGYTVTLTSTSSMTNGPPCGVTPSGSDVTLPANLPVSVSLPAPSAKAGYDVNLYGAPATAFSVPTAGMTQQQISAIPNSLYAVIAGDFMAGINFGYVGPGSTASQNSANWYSNPPILYPFASTRKTNDGFYNPYAAVFYNLSDAYGFAYSDRGGRPSPYVPLPSNATTVRITILNDNRLDAPQVAVSNPTNTSLTITWPVVSGATAYAVTVSYGAGIPVPGITLTPSPPSPSGTTISGLSPGTTYQISVTATSTLDGNPVSSFTVPVYSMTTGTLAKPEGTLQFGTSLNWSVNASGCPPANYTFTINQQPYTPSGPGPCSNTNPYPTINGSLGTNVYGLTITDGSNTIYQGEYVVNLTQTAGQYYLDAAFLTPPNSHLLTPAWNGGKAPPYPGGPISPIQSLVIGTPFAPVATKKPGPVVFP
ncbi:fibronectin type III domain-containing protein [Nitrospira sp. Kam-Ns4a]